MGAWIIGTLLGPLALLRRAPGKAFGLLALVVFLTLTTQIGGLLLWISLYGTTQYSRRWRQPPLAKAIPIGIFAILYLATSLWLVPPLAAAWGRVPLPCTTWQVSALQPRSMLFCLANRHYVTPKLRNLLLDLARALEVEHPSGRVDYLDGGFPFLDGFPLLPHLSHHDGRKIDLAFFYRDLVTGAPTPPPSPIGYWAYEAPRPGETMPCKSAGLSLRWDFDWLQAFFAKSKFDLERTRWVLNWLLLNRDRYGLSKILIEPHLKIRMGLSHDLIKFQGCRAARHDDHLHLQIR